MENMLYSLGNKKIGKDTLIMNIHTGMNCPAQDKCLIRQVCYAVANERIRPTVRAYRQRQEELWRNNPASFFIDGLIAAKKPNLKYIRFQEAGDFANQKDVDKMFEIAEALSGYYKCYTYTCRHDLNYDLRPPNLVMNGTYFMLDNMFIPLYSQPYDKIMGEFPKAMHCPGDCRTCAYCKLHGNREIYQRVH